MNLANILTLGLLPLYRRLFVEERSLLRMGIVGLSFEFFGNPRVAVLKKVVKQLDISDKEQDHVVRSIQHDGQCYVIDVEMGEVLLDLLDKNGFHTVHEQSSEVYEPVYWDEKLGKYRSVDSLNYCRDCHRKGVRYYYNFYGTYCSSCKSENLIFHNKMSPKEFNNYVSKFESLPSRAKGDSTENSTSDTARVYR